jgi:hypothetical protein
MADENSTIEMQGAEALGQAMTDYVANTRFDMGRAITKAGRELAMALYQEFHDQPPRPKEGSITAAAKGRRWRMNSMSRSYLSGHTAAAALIGPGRSGYFRVVQAGDGVLIAQPIILGARRKVVLAGRKGLSRGSLLRSTDQLKDANSVPTDAVRLNIGSLAVIKALDIRERAGMGGYLSAQFLAYKKIRQGAGPQRQSVLMENNVKGGSITIAGDDKGNISATVEGPLPGTMEVATRHGIAGKALNRAAESYRADMMVYLKRKLGQQIGGRN